MEVIGDGVAPSLFSLGADSIIRVKNNVDLAQDTATVYRVSVYRACCWSHYIFLLIIHLSFIFIVTIGFLKYSS